MPILTRAVPSPKCGQTCRSLSFCVDHIECTFITNMFWILPSAGWSHSLPGLKKILDFKSKGSYQNDSREQKANGSGACKIFILFACGCDCLHTKKLVMQTPQLLSCFMVSCLIYWSPTWRHLDTCRWTAAQITQHSNVSVKHAAFKTCGHHTNVK